MPKRASKKTPAPAPQEHRTIIAGFGGQGVLTLGKLLCMSALNEGRQVTYLPSYGSEVRGGTANCQVVISSHPISSPLVEEPDSLIVLNTLSYERFAATLKPGGLMVLNSSGTDTNGASAPGSVRVLSLPAAEMAAEMGSVKVTNVVMLGAFLTVCPVVKPETALAALKELLGRKADLLALNVRAFQEGSRRAGTETATAQ